MEVITAVRGFKDILPRESGKWQFIEECAREILANFGFREIRVPILEKTELFRRSIGESTDIVEKEMYTFVDRGDECLTLRPEATASVMRAYLEHSLYAQDAVVRLFTIGPMFRRERPQKGRLRQFHQINAELLGLDEPRADAEVILMLMQFLTRVGVEGLHLEINSLGCKTCRPAFRDALKVFLAGREAELCADCQRRLAINPLRVFDCKTESCKEVISHAPRILDFLCPDCKDHFANVKHSLDIFKIGYKVNPKMVRGLDYYAKTTFEVVTEHLGAQNAVAGGGRYDGLVKDLGGPDVPGIGFAVGMERLISLSNLDDDKFLSAPEVFIAAIGERAQNLAFSVCNHLRMAGIQAEMDYAGRSLKSQMKRADKLSSLRVLILGDREIEEGRAQLRDMRGGTQETIVLDNNVEQTIAKIVRGS
ncbi:MAG TPA: histidine--tRNA ligase [Syntrophales bacterium]|nr:histidine--tRNA ligase [Syntrophales bacterium]